MLYRLAQQATLGLIHLGLCLSITACRAHATWRPVESTHAEPPAPPRGDDVRRRPPEGPPELILEPFPEPDALPPEAVALGAR
jgi:hypothetical protein